jgi:hypothetical protein
MQTWFYGHNDYTLLAHRVLLRLARVHVVI